MNVIFDMKGSGKTEKLIKISHKKWMPIVCLSYKEVHNIFQRAKELKIDIPFPCIYSEIEKTHRIGHYKGVVVDNADMLIERMLGVRIDTITLTKELKE